MPPYSAQRPYCRCRPLGISEATELMEFDDELSAPDQEIIWCIGQDRPLAAFNVHLHHETVARPDVIAGQDSGQISGAR